MMLYCIARASRVKLYLITLVFDVSKIVFTVSSSIYSHAIYAHFIII